MGLATALLLLVSDVAMRFTARVSWGPGDFGAATALLVTAGMANVHWGRKVQTFRKRVAVGLITSGALAVLWAELALDVCT